MTPGAETNTATNTLNVRIEKARAEKQIDRRLESLARLGSELTLADIPGAIKAFDNLKSVREQLVFRDSVLKRWGELAPAEAFAYVSQLPEGLPKVEAIRSIAIAYARTNPLAAATAALKMKPGRARTEAVSLISETWARNNINEALKWANDLPPGPLKQTALRSIYFVWVHSDPAAASAIVQNLPSGDTKTALLINIAQNWAVTDRQAAIKWAQSLHVDAEKDLAIVIATESWADYEPEAALQFALNLPAPELRRRAVVIALERWATQDPQRAFAKAARLADPILQEQGIVRVLDVCAPINPVAASQWIEQLLGGTTVWDKAIEAYVEAVHTWQPEAAARLAVKAKDPTARERTIEKAMTLWLKLDPAAAKQWLADAEIPDETKQRLNSLNAAADLEF